MIFRKDSMHEAKPTENVPYLHPQYNSAIPGHIPRTNLAL